MNKFISLALCWFLLTGCSNKELYQVGQDYKKSDCLRKAASGPQHSDCSKAEKKPFEEYEEERKEVIKK